MKASFRILSLTLFCISQGLAQGADPLQCRIEALKELGWTVVADAPGSSVKGKSESLPCGVDHQATLHVPSRALSSRESARAIKDIDELLHQDNSFCLFLNHFRNGLKVATRKLEAAKNGFGMGQNGLVCKVSRGWAPLPPAKNSMGGLLKDLKASTSPSAAVDAFYDGSASYDCLVGQQALIWASARETFGSQFDSAFKPEEVTVGHTLEMSKPFEKIPTIKIESLMKYGPAGLIGIPGYIQNAKTEKDLDSVNNRGENLVITSMTQKAFDSLKGFWGGAKLSEKDGFARAMGGGSEREIANVSNERIKKAGRDPFLSETEIVIHPMNTTDPLTVIFMLHEMNPRTHYKFNFSSYKDLRRPVFFPRFVEGLRRKHGCGGSL